MFHLFNQIAQKLEMSEVCWNLIALERNLPHVNSNHNSFTSDHLFYSNQVLIVILCLSSQTFRIICNYSSEIGEIRVCPVQNWHNNDSDSLAVAV